MTVPHANSSGVDARVVLPEDECCKAAQFQVGFPAEPLLFARQAHLPIGFGVNMRGSCSRIIPTKSPR